MAKEEKRNKGAAQDRQTWSNETKKLTILL